MTVDDVSTTVQMADRVAAEVRHAHLRGESRLVKVTSLMSAFRRPGHPARINEVIRLLGERGIKIDSGWLTDSGEISVRRPGLLELSLDDSGKTREPGAEEIQLSVWNPGTGMSPERDPASCDPPGVGEVLWFNVEPPSAAALGGANVEPAQVGDSTAAAPTSAFELRVRDVSDQLREWCHGLDEEMVRDLLRQDVQPKVETYGDERDSVRSVSAVAVIARELPDPDDYDGVTEQLVFQMVEMVVGDGWIVTCWHPSRIFSGTHEETAGPAMLRASFLNHVEHRWLHDGVADDRDPPIKTASDLGLYLTRSLVDTYGASHRMLERWVSSWEADFYAALATSVTKEKSQRMKNSAREITDLLAMVGEFRRRLTALQHARWATPDRTWFPALSDRDESVLDEEDQSPQASELADRLDSVDKKTTLLSEGIRADMDLLMLQVSATQQEQNERLQGYLAKVTGLVLVPTFVAGLFGANTRLPGGGSWVGFDLMVVLMVVSSIAVYLIMRRLAR